MSRSDTKIFNFALLTLNLKSLLICRHIRGARNFPSWGLFCPDMGGEV